MCIPKFILHYLVLITYPIAVIIASSYDSSYGFITFIIFGTLGTLVKCPSCRKSVSITKNGWATPIIFIHCDKCGQNLLKCKIEKDLDNKKEDL